MRRMVASGSGRVARRFGSVALYFLGCALWLAQRAVTLPALLACWAGRCSPAEIRLRLVIARSAGGAPVVLPSQATARVEAARALLAAHGIRLAVDGPFAWSDAFTRHGLACRSRAIWQPAFASLEREARRSRNITVFFLPQIEGAQACSFPGTRWTALDPSSDGSALVHELGHLAGLWRHSRDPDNVMTNVGGGAADRVTHLQACVLRTAPRARRRAAPAASRSSA